MKIKVYLQEWFYNAGIVGFLKLLENQKEMTILKKENYIEFDSEILRNFHHYYFAYWMEKYDVAKRMKERLDISFSYLESLLKQEPQTKVDKKRQQEELKTSKKRLKESLKKQLDKIKKYDTALYQKILEQYEKIDLFQGQENISELKECKEVLQECFQQKEINLKLTSNIFKSILSNQFYGQISFLNVVKSNAPYEEQKEIMYRDYVSNIVEAGFLHDVLDEKYSFPEIESYIRQALEEANLTNEMRKIYQTLQTKFLEKQKGLEEIKKYLKEKVFQYCCMCGKEEGLTSNFSEGHFIPLAMSSENAQNFFWNQDVKFPICDMCKLILFCIPIGVTPVSKVVRTIKNGEIALEEREMNCFVNFDTDINELYKVNMNFKNQSKTNKLQDNPYVEMLLSIVSQQQKIAEWKLKNIFVVEFEAEYNSFSRIYYFHIPNYLARFFTLYANRFLKPIHEYEYRLQLVDNCLKNKDLKYVIEDKLFDYIRHNKVGNEDAISSIGMRYCINQLKKGMRTMDIEKLEKNQKKLYILYNLGVAIHEHLKLRGEENKLNGYTYKMLNTLKAKNQDEFMNLVIRLHMLLGKDVSPIFIQSMQDEDLDFVSVGQSFLAGLISNRYEKEEENHG